MERHSKEEYEYIMRNVIIIGEIRTPNFPTHGGKSLALRANKIKGKARKVYVTLHPTATSAAR